MQVTLLPNKHLTSGPLAVRSRLAMNLRRNRLRATHALSAAVLCLPLTAVAQTETIGQKSNLTVKRIFAEGQAGGGFYTAEDISADCLWGLFYIDMSGPGGRGQLALLISAKAQNLRLQRVDYKKNVAGYPAGACLVSGLHVE
jgi:hypothetical protein